MSPSRRWLVAIPTGVTTTIAAGDRGARHLDHAPLAQPHAHFRDLLAERRPGQRRVEIDDVASRTVRDVLEDVLASAVAARDRHEGAAQVMDAAVPLLELRQVLAEAPQGSVDVAERLVGGLGSRRQNEILILRRAAHHLGPPAELPGGEHLRQRRVHRHQARHPRLDGLHALVLDVVALGDDELAERLRALVVGTPAQRRQLAEAQPREHEHGVDDAPIERDALVGDERFRLIAREHRARAPEEILVDLLRQIAGLEVAGVDGDEFVGGGAPKERVQGEVDVSLRARREQLVVLGAQRRQHADDKFPDVARANVLE